MFLFSDLFARLNDCTDFDSCEFLCTDHTLRISSASVHTRAVSICVFLSSFITYIFHYINFLSMINRIIVVNDLSASIARNVRTPQYCIRDPIKKNRLFLLRLDELITFPRLLDCRFKSPSHWLCMINTYTFVLITTN